MCAKNRYVDLSHTLYEGLVTYKGVPGPLICDFLSREASRSLYDQGTEFLISRIDMVANSGTYIDCPYHRYRDGKDLSEVRLDRFADLDAVVVRAPYGDRLDVGLDRFQGIDVAGKAVLIHTGWSVHWSTPAYLNDHPFLTQEAAAFLRDQGAHLVGIDSHNIDDTRSRNNRPVHTILLRQDILIVEHLTGLEQLPADKFLFSAVPPKVRGMGTFPVRAFAKLT
jgi:kynurenine formamidase